MQSYKITLEEIYYVEHRDCCFDEIYLYGWLYYFFILFREQLIVPKVLYPVFVPKSNCHLTNSILDIVDLNSKSYNNK